MIDPGITLDVAYEDSDFLEVIVSVANGRFSGAISIYTAAREFAEASLVLSGFPRGRGDVREVRLGAPGLSTSST